MAGVVWVQLAMVFGSGVDKPFFRKEIPRGQSYGEEMNCSSPALSTTTTAMSSSPSERVSPDVCDSPAAPAVPAGWGGAMEVDEDD